MIGNLKIDNVDVFSLYQVFVTEGGCNGLVSAATFKDIDINDWAEEDGIEADLSNPVLDTKEFSINFSCLDNTKSEDFISLFSDRAYHIFDFIELGIQRKLRLVSELNNTTFLYAETFSLQFADDFPLEDYTYLEPINPIPQSGYNIDNKSLSAYGVWILEGSYDEIKRTPAVKKNLTLSYKNKSGAIYDSERVNYQSKDVALKCCLRANSIDVFWRNYNALIYDLTRPKERLFYVKQADSTFRCYYKKCTVSRFALVNFEVWCEFTLTLVFTNYRPLSIIDKKDPEFNYLSQFDKLDYQEQTINVHFESNVEYLYSNIQNQRIHINSVEIEGEPYTLGTLVPIKHRKSENLYKGVISITISQNDAFINETLIISLLAKIKESEIVKELEIIQGYLEKYTLPEYVKGEIGSFYHEVSANPNTTGTWNTWWISSHNWDSKDHTDETGEWLWNGINKQTLQTIEIGEHVFTRQNFMFKYVQEKDDGYANVTQAQIDTAFATTNLKIAETYDQSRYINGAYTVCDGVVYDAVNVGTFYNNSTDRIEIEPFKIPTVGDWVQVMSMADDTSYQGILQFMGVKPAKVDESGSIIENGGDEELPYPYDHIWENNTNKWDASGLHLIPSARRLNAGNGDKTGSFYSYRKSVGLRAANEDGSLAPLLVAIYVGANKDKAGNNTESIALQTQDSGAPYHLGSVRLCRRKTPEELGYQLYADSVTNKVIVTKWSDEAPTVNGIILKPIPIGRLRGVCVRYLNKDKTQVLASLSHLQEIVSLTNTGNARWYGFDNY